MRNTIHISGQAQTPAFPAANTTYLRAKIVATRAEIAAAEKKRIGIENAIRSRNLTLKRLLAQLATCEAGAAYSQDE